MTQRSNNLDIGMKIQHDIIQRGLPGHCVCWPSEVIYFCPRRCYANTTNFMSQKEIESNEKGYCSLRQLVFGITKHINHIRRELSACINSSSQPPSDFDPSPDLELNFPIL